MNATTPTTTLRRSEARLHAADEVGILAGIRKFGGFLTWLFTGFGLIPQLVRGRAARGRAPQEIVVYCVHRAFYLWALIFTGFLGAACVHHYPHTAVAWGWVYIIVLLYTLATLLFDVGTFRFLLWGGIFGFAWLASEYLENLKHVPVLSVPAAYLRDLRPSLSAGFASALSWLLVFPWVGAMFHSFSRGRKTFSPNSIEEYFLGEGREITDRAGLKFRSRYRDVFETVLGLGAGDLEAVDGNQQVVKRWENVIFLCFVWNRLDTILHQRAATVDNAPENPVEIESARR